ncbi:MAG: hypothetical protein GXP01_05945 [Alphaproteobacteria bacterium]|nr:hypothetical protein [Alphaproteobacteria bacterium]
MSTDFMLALFIIALGLSVAGAGTHLYQMVWRQQAMLRFDGATYIRSMGHLAMSFVCGPYIMLMLGWKSDDKGKVIVSAALLSSFIAFTWSFLTGIMFLGAYVASTGA